MVAPVQRPTMGGLRERL